MTRFEEELQNNLTHIAAKAAVSTDAWHRVAARLGQEEEAGGLTAITILPVDPSDADGGRNRARNRALEVDPVERRGSPLLLVAAALVALLSGAIALGTFRSESTTVVTSSEVQTALNLAMAYIEAANEVDAGALRNLVADDAQIFDDPALSPDEFWAKADFMRATRQRYVDVRCEVVEGSQPVEVDCVYKLESAISDALGLGAGADVAIDFTAEGGKLIWVRNEMWFGERIWPGWERFVAWMQEHHPDDMTEMVGFFGLANEITPEMIDLWDQRVADFVLAHESGDVDEPVRSEDATDRSGISVERGAPLGEIQTEPVVGELKLWVSNQSFADDPVGITISIDEVVVVDETFEVRGQHNWVPFFIRGLEPGPHAITAISDTGAELGETFTVLDDEPLWIVVDYWYESGDSAGRQFILNEYNDPVAFG